VRCITRAVAGALVLLALTTLRAQGAPSLRTVLGRLHQYLSSYAERIPATIASEHYVQQTSQGPPLSTTLDSDFGIVRLPGIKEWLGFRDVLVKDGNPVAERQQRLDAIFRNPSVDAARQAQLVADEGARHNLGPFYRTINNPALVLELLDRRNEWRMKFKKTGEAVVDGVHTWIVQFREVERPTVISATQGGSAPSDGLAWIDPAEGTLIRVEATVRTTNAPPRDLVSKLTVTFVNDAKLGFWVPSTMTERYETRRGAFLASGEATYSNYRLFTVDTRVIVHGTTVP
jgi:hypothetical protein